MTQTTLTIEDRIAIIKTWEPPYATSSWLNALGTKYCVSFGRSCDHYWLRVYANIPSTRASADFLRLAPGEIDGFIDTVEAANYDDEWN